LDKHSEVGGRNRPIHLGDFTFDTGPTFLLMKHILDEMFELCGKNSADYFIHKDLGGFLRRELDFYIKNEVMHF
jgi:phytoene dehydrogenase-like protein